MSTEESMKNENFNDSDINKNASQNTENNFKGYNNFEQNTEEKVLSNYLKVLIVALVILLPVGGLILGIVMSIVYMTSVYEDYKTFGRALLVLVLVYLGISILCCAISFFLGTSLMGELFRSLEHIANDPYVFYY